MSDIVYSVEVKYLQSGNFNAPAAGLDKLQSKTDKWTDSLLAGTHSFASSFNGTLDSLAGTVVGFGERAGVALGGALAAGVGFTLKEGLSFADYVEGQINGVATTLGMLGDVPMDQGIKEATKSVEHLRQAAAVLPGEFKDAMNAFQAILPVGLNEGVATSRLEKMAAHSVAVAAALGVPQRVAGHELAAMLEGRARSSMPLVTKMGVGSATAFNKLSAADRFKRIEDVFAKTDPAMAVYQNSWAGLTSTAKDTGRNVARSFASPLFDSLKGELSHGLDWFGKNETAVHAFATRLGVGVDQAFHRGLDLIHEWYGPVTTFAHTIGSGLHSAFGRVEPYLDRLETVAKHFLQDPAAFDKLVDGAKTFAELRAGGAALQGGTSLLSSLSSVGLLGGGKGAAGEVAAMGEVIPFAVAGLAALVTAAYGVTSALDDTSSAYHDAMVSLVGNITKDSAQLGEDLLKPSSAFTRFSQQVGVIGSYWLDSTVTSLDLQLKAANAFSGAMDGVIARLLGPQLHTDPVDLGSHGFELPPSIKWQNAEAEREKERKIPQTVVNLHSGAIQLRVDGSGDPTRVAKLASDMLREQLGRAAARGGQSNAATIFGVRP